MDIRRGWSRRALVGLVLAAGCSDYGPPRGELGLASFVWICDDGADYGCGQEAFPDDIAVGSRFEASFDVHRDDVGAGAGVGSAVKGASPSLIGPAGSELAVLAQGEVALLATQSGTLIDFTMVDLYEVSRVALRRPAEADPYCRADDDDDDEPGEEDEPEPCSPGPIIDRAEDSDTPYTIVEMEPQTARLLEAIPLRGSLPLAGRFDYTWKSLDPTRLTVSTRSRGRVLLDFHGPWAAELQVTASGSSYVVLVRAPGSDEVPDPFRTGGRR